METDRGKEACRCSDKLTAQPLSNTRSLNHRRQQHLLQICEATYRNPIEGRFQQASVPSTTKPFSFVGIGKLGACAEKVNRLILGRLAPKSGSRLYAQSRNGLAKASSCRQFAAEVVVGTHHTPLMNPRTHPPCATRCLTNGLPNKECCL